MLVDLISTTNDNGIRLDGAFFAPPFDAKPIGPVDAILLIHGSRGNFAEPNTRDMAEELRQIGYACLALNTTAHDTVWANASDDMNYGNAYEIIDDTCRDLKAGVDYLWNAGYRRIALMGHSMGAVRVAYYAATQADQRVAAVIPISPVRLSYSYYQASGDAKEFNDLIRRARELEEKGEGRELFDADFPIKQLFSAVSYLDKHGPEERYNLINLAPNIRIPMFVVGGSLESHTRLLNMAKDLAEAAVNSPEVECAIIEGGNHSIANKKKEAATTVLRWLASLSPQPVKD
jgi:alpha-beta hydrolase superfamily lysophospholipase